MKTGFFAYASNPPVISETIEDAISELNKSNIWLIKSWKELKINGNYIINEVLKKIKDSDFFCADLTGLNDNVLFEIGYAIGINKPILLFNDTSQTESYRKYKELDFFTTIGYSDYTNTQNIIDTFYKNNPSEKKGSLDELLNSVLIEDKTKPLLFLKNQIDSNYNSAILKSIENIKLTVTTDDATEIKVQPFSWYLKEISSSQSLLAEFSSTSRSGFEVQNSKCSVLTGLAIGLDLKVLMICENPYSTPLDYKDLMKKFSTRSECISVISPFLNNVKEDYFDILTKSKINKQIQAKRSELQSINFGEFLAEHERDQLSDYYIETTASQNLTRNEYNIVVGRKGSGKSATLYYLKNSLEQDPRSHICIIRPFNFDLDGLLYTLKNVPEHFQKSYLIESVWKLIIYTEITKSIYEKLILRNSATLNPEELDLILFVEKENKLFASEFHERIYDTFQSIDKYQELETDEYKVKVSEALHIESLPIIKETILKALGKGRTIYLLVDNLDKSWKKGEALEYQSRWILGLLGLTGKLIKELSNNKNNIKDIKFQMTIFLRSDIFNYVLSFAREPDKIQFTKLKVEDKEILFRIIEERFLKLSSTKMIAEDLWTKFLPLNVEGLNLRDFLFSIIIPRPRDIIYIFNKMREIAVFRGHSKIEETDIISAYKEYSDWILSSILVENGVTLNQMEDFLYQFAGENSINYKIAA
jgi:hypothetical protein